MRFKMFIQARFFVSLAAVFCVALSAAFLPNPARCSSLPQVGTTLPSFQLPGPPAENDRIYLGLKSATFALKDVECRLLVVEILGVYCPFCYEQAPFFNKFYTRLDKKNLSAGVKMLGVAVGATVAEVEYLRKNGSYEYPVVQDEGFAVHKLLGEPRTPFTMLLDRDGKVLFAHQGKLEDTDALYKLIEDHLKQQ